MRVELTQGYHAIVDDADFERVSGLSWRSKVERRPGRLPRVDARVNGPRKPIGGRSIIYMARLIAGAGPGEVVDHRNGNPLDNRRANLRLTDATGNAINRRSRSKLGLPKGVSPTSSGYGYRVQLGRNGKACRRYCKTLEEARTVAASEALRLYGQLAYEARV